MAAPVIAAVNDHETERLLEAVVGSGAQWAGHRLPGLPHEVKDLFREWLQGHMPLRAGHVMSLVRRMRGGRDNDPQLGDRMQGEGAAARHRSTATVVIRYSLLAEPQVNRVFVPGRRREPAEVRAGLFYLSGSGVYSGRNRPAKCCGSSPPC